MAGFTTEQLRQIQVSIAQHLEDCKITKPNPMNTDISSISDSFDNLNVIDIVAASISNQFAYNSKELAQRQARAAIDKLCDILEAAMNNPNDPFVPDGATVVNCMRLIARTPSEFLSV